jgi:hypothetical protein
MKGRTEHIEVQYSTVWYGMVQYSTVQFKSSKYGTWL